MAITLNHTIVPARDKHKAAKLFADIFGLEYSKKRSGHFAPVRVNKDLTLDFDDDKSFDSHHYAFKVGEREFDAIFKRIVAAKIDYGSAPWILDDGEINNWNGGRGVYFRCPDGHIYELLTRDD